MTALDLARFLILMLPAAALFTLHVARDDTPRTRSAALFAGLLGALVTLMACAGYGRDLPEEAALFRLSGAALYGVPVDIALAHGLILALCQLYARARGRLLVGLALPSALVLMLSLAYFSHIPHSLLPLITAITMIPALRLGYWTASDRRVYARSILQALMWCALLLWLLPATAMAHISGNWNMLRTQPPLLYLPLLFPAALMVQALYVFARYGNGTGFPYDPPKRLVTQGIYAYVSNPMQIAIVFVMGWWGVLLGNETVVICSPFALLLFLVFKDVCNGSSNVCGKDPAFVAYQRAVPRWWPRFSPYRPPAPAPDDAAAQNNPVKKSA